ncbi:hypothetical protein [Sporomusa sp.]|uniref:hypothetical protein n=1 Tax=Sporomusa sp. TaxID=2078658 RepID=UPI002BD048D6|nr:hypothetical protein [Sporomusa sp.]HWR43710.1 hypothetical protein [Sporomusa sp.]
MCTTIVQGIPVAADSSLSQDQISQLVSELKQTWTWEGRQVGRIELICAGQMIHLLAYEKPVFQCIPLKYNESKGANQ